MSARVPTATDAEIEALLSRAPMRPVGRIVASSNQAVLVEIGSADDHVLAIHKPLAAERPLWDYPRRTLALRERAAYLVCRGMGLDLVPPTVLREGPWGRGSVQLWIGEPDRPATPVVTFTPVDEAPPGWLTVLTGEDQRGRRVSLAHAPDEGLRSVAVLDAVLNNSDRKGGHLVRAPEGLRGFDHGVSLGLEPKLRTVLWGWAGLALPDADTDRLRQLQGRLDAGLAERLGPLLDEVEIVALRARIEDLLATGRHPLPSSDWPAIPWPAL